MEILFLLIFSFQTKLIFALEKSVYFIPPPPFISVSPIYYKPTQSFYFLSGKLDYSNFITGLQRVYYDQKASHWRYESIKDTSVPDRINYGSFFDGTNSYYIFGGIGSDGLYNDMWKYHIDDNRWTQILNVNPIKSRWFFAYTAFTLDDNLYFAVLGGVGSDTNQLLDQFYL
jgi:Galactose oxidase, central domain